MLPGRMLDGRYPSSPCWTKLQIYITRVRAPPNAALQGRLTQLVEEDDGICIISIVIGIVVGIAIGIA